MGAMVVSIAPQMTDLESYPAPQLARPYVREIRIMGSKLSMDLGLWLRSLYVGIGVVDRWRPGPRRPWIGVSFALSH
jgi:hypothetical protein